MIGAGLAHQLVADRPPLVIGMDQLLKGGLAVLGGGVIVHAFGGEDVFLHQLLRLVQPTVQIDGRQDRFKGVGQDGGLLSTTALLFAPLLLRLFGPLSPISIGGATTADTTLPTISRVSGTQFIPVAIFHGLVVDLSVPLLVPFFCAL